jgi:subtilisin family serine protease
MQRLIVEMAYQADLASAAGPTGSGATTAPAGVLPKIVGVTFDPDFGPVALPGISPRSATIPDELAKFDIGAATAWEPDLAFEASTFLVVATAADEKATAALAKARNVVGVFADVELTTCVSCPTGPIGTDKDVETQLNVSALGGCGMDGTGVRVAIVDTGFNVEYLRSKGKPTRFDAQLSWAPAVMAGQAPIAPGNEPVDHGTMVAYDVMIAAPNATLIDVPLLSPRRGGAFTSSAIAAYRHLMWVMSQPSRFSQNPSLVVNNSWATWDIRGDFPIGDPRNYSANANHPLNKIVTALAQQGADIVFAAGNCGGQCPPYRSAKCGGAFGRTIYGANSLPDVLTVGAVDVTRDILAYSALGPGFIEPRKPDLTAYSHFAGSGVYSADSGTSAAAPVASGVVAALRTKTPYVAADPTTSPAAIRQRLTSGAIDGGPIGFDFEYGHGVIDTATIRSNCRPPVCQLLPCLEICGGRGCGCKEFPWRPECRPVPEKLCERFPWLPGCRQIFVPDICKLNPRLCQLLEKSPIRDIPRELMDSIPPHIFEQIRTGSIDGMDATSTGSPGSSVGCGCGCSE